MNSSIESKHIKGGEFMTHSVTKVAAAHIAPVFLDKKATTAKAISWIEEAAKHGAQLREYLDVSHLAPADGAALIALVK